MNESVPTRNFPNPFQRLILTSTFLGFLALSLFPPWISANPKLPSFLGFHFIFSAPSNAAIGVSMLSTLAAIVLLMGGVATLLVADRTRVLPSSARTRWFGAIVVVTVALFGIIMYKDNLKAIEAKPQEFAKSDKLVEAAQAPKTRSTEEITYLKEEITYMQNIMLPVQEAVSKWGTERNAFYRKTEAFTHWSKPGPLLNYCSQLKQEINECQSLLTSYTAPLKFADYDSKTRAYLSEQLANVEAYETVIEGNNVGVMLRIINDMIQSTNNYQQSTIDPLFSPEAIQL